MFYHHKSWGLHRQTCVNSIYICESKKVKIIIFFFFDKSHKFSLSNEQKQSYVMFFVEAKLMNEKQKVNSAKLCAMGKM